MSAGLDYRLSDIKEAAMSTQVIAQQPPSAKPVVAGVINIVIGSGALLAFSIIAIVLVAGSLVVPFVGLLIPLIGVPFVGLAVVALVGGIFAVQRRMWGWALAGSIATTLMSNLLGVISIVLVALSKGEFPNGRTA